MMLNKKLIRNNFQKSLESYNENAYVQRVMADKLFNLLPVKDIDKALEIGMGTGFLTKLLIKEANIKEFYANDIVPECDEFLYEIDENSCFIAGDIEEVILPDNFDLIISNAALQWAVDFPFLVKKISSLVNKNGYFLFSTFGQDNLKELKELTDIGLEYISIDSLRSILSEKFEIISIVDEECQVFFTNFKELIKHLKMTGVNGIADKPVTYSKFKTFEKEYKKCYSSGKGVMLTYNPIFVLCQRK